jgi:hypothetical protein
MWRAQREKEKERLWGEEDTYGAPGRHSGTSKAIGLKRRGANLQYVHESDSIALKRE